ncbi:MAG: DUF2069 domain-containing protein [Rhodanobacter denitrificans]|uniref:DUF2069 domain-containing protein n=1 Tax=Rhodanobacter denitrificans TaxID=666685 RepID=A0A2W5KML0_9GAMM|nr:MAG: DUF2069 domain-containing protein [Rhodanobacter denitrificans]
MSAARFGLLAWIGLIALQPAWYLWLAPPANGRALLALGIMLAPLLLPLFALRSGSGRLLTWIGIVSLFYFCHGIVAAYAVPAARGPALLQVALCSALIGALGWSAISAKRRARRSAAATP